MHVWLKMISAYAISSVISGLEHDFSSFHENTFSKNRGTGILRVFFTKLLPVISTKRDLSGKNDHSYIWFISVLETNYSDIEGCTNKKSQIRLLLL